MASSSCGSRRFPPPWSVEETDACYIVPDADGRALAMARETERSGTKRGLVGA